MIGPSDGPPMSAKYADAQRTALYGPIVSRIIAPSTTVHAAR